jgi:hypothetical protein
VYETKGHHPVMIISSSARHITLVCEIPGHPHVSKWVRRGQPRLITSTDASVRRVQKETLRDVSDGHMVETSLIESSVSL